MGEHIPEWVPSGEGNLVCRVCDGDYGAPHNAGDEFDLSVEASVISGPVSEANDD